MRIPFRLGSALILFLLSTLGWADVPEQKPNYLSDSDVLSPSQQTIAKIRSQFETLRMNEKDFKLSAGWELPFTIPAVENFFAKPLDIPAMAGEWADRIEETSDVSGLLDTAFHVMGITPTESSAAPLVLGTPLPAQLKPAITVLVSAIKEAQPFLDRAVDSLPASAREGLLGLNEWPDPQTGAVRQEISARRTKQKYEAMKPFSQQDLAEAGARVFAGVDKALKMLPKSADVKKQVRWKTVNGDILIGGRGDDVYDKADLKDVAVLIDLGGNNIYKAPVATAREKQIRIVIDYGANVQVDGENFLHGNAGAGIFGIGVMVLPNGEGTKIMKTGPFSQGFGMGGIGALVVNGTAHLSAQRSVQGMGIFGVGILSAKSSKGSTYVATRSGQGSAWTRGVGIFLHEGDDADIKGGLVQPDPREPLGSVSLCQGVGFGPRAYAGGGVGIAVVKGNRISVKGSYFSQGVGYWHGFGAFRLRGDGNTLQARRYDMGSGVHSAFGHMDVFGNNNRILNWGVGPSYGWDHGVGSSIVFGNDNEMQTEWGSGTASIGSLSFSYIKGERNKMKLCDFGTNNFFRDEPAYSVQIIDGVGNQLQCHGSAETNGERLRRMRTPWGLFQMRGTTLVENLGLTPPEWPELPREEAVEREMVDLGEQIEQSAGKPPLDEVADLIDIASAFSLDKVTPRRAMHELLVLPPEKAVLMADVLDPSAVDQLIYLSVAMPAHGDTTAKALVKSLKGPATPQKKAVMLNFLRMARPRTAAPALMEFVNGPASDELRLNALRAMAALLNKDAGAEPGPRAALITVLNNLERPSKKNKQEALGLIAKMRVGEALGLAATIVDMSADDRAEMLENAPEDLTSPLGEKAGKIFLTIAAREKKMNMKNVKDQLAQLEELEPQARRMLAELLTSSRAATVNTVAIGLGQIANGDDAKLLEPLLRHENTRVRESAAVALARMGDAGLPVLQRALESSEPRDRALALAGMTQSATVKSLALVEKALNDENPNVRLTAVAVIDNLPEILKPKRAGVVARVKKEIPSETDPDVRLALELLR